MDLPATFPLYLRLEKWGTQYAFYSKQSAGAAWTLLDTQSYPGAIEYVGIENYTFYTGTADTTLDAGYFTLEQWLVDEAYPDADAKLYTEQYTNTDQYAYIDSHALGHVNSTAAAHPAPDEHAEPDPETHQHQDAAATHTGTAAGRVAGRHHLHL